MATRYEDEERRYRDPSGRDRDQTWGGGDQGRPDRGRDWDREMDRDRQRGDRDYRGGWPEPGAQGQPWAGTGAGSRHYGGDFGPREQRYYDDEMAGRRSGGGGQWGMEGGYVPGDHDRGYDPDYRRGYARDDDYRHSDRAGTRGRDRTWMDKAADEVGSWMGFEGAERRREEDKRGRGPKGYQRSDERISEDVHDRLTDDAMVDASEISVSVKDREVTLSGTVDSRQAKRRAEDCCDSVSGVAHVQNNLRVQGRDEAAKPAEQSGTEATRKP